VLVVLKRKTKIFIKKKKKKERKPGVVGHSYNPSFSGGREQEDRGSRPGWGNSLCDPHLEKTQY
jgi:hypothetical protein